MIGAPFKPRPEDLSYLRRLGWTLMIAAVLLMACAAACARTARTSRTRSD